MAMVRLSVNVNKVATLRNSRGGRVPSVVDAVNVCMAAGSPGITVHPRADARHITAGDVRAIAGVVRGHEPPVELNIEGDPRPDLIALVHEVRPERCACGNTMLALLRPYYTHQVLELPPIAMEVTHWVLHQGWCGDCGHWTKAQVPPEQRIGYGPRFSARVAELAGTYGNGRRMVQTFCASVLRVPLSLGAIQKVLDRVTQAIEPHYTTIATQARQALVNYIDETPWFLTHTLQWLWVMASDTVAFYMIHPHRSKEAFAALIDDWAGILVSDDYGVYQNWVQARQTCLAHLITYRP